VPSLGCSCRRRRFFRRDPMPRGFALDWLIGALPGIAVGIGTGKDEESDKHGSAE